jgi:hypothetical protein
VRNNKAGKQLCSIIACGIEVICASQIYQTRRALLDGHRKKQHFIHNKKKFMELIKNLPI